MSPSASEVFAALERAFPKVPINMDLAFTEWGRTYPDAGEVRSFANGRTWDSLAARYLETHEDLFGFLGTDALADILPAALAALSRGASPHGALPYALAVVLKRPASGRSGGLGRRRYDALLARLSAAQQQAVAAALRLFIEEHPEAGPAEHIREALDSYWVELISSGAEP